jgi:hypothetical protein
LNWGAISNASIAVLNGGQFNQQGVGAPGSVTASPTTTTTYTLTATCSNGGGTRTNSVTVNVSGNPPPAACSGTPVINNFTASSTSTRPNQEVTFSWSAPTNADKLHFKGLQIDQDVPLSGSLTFNPLVTNPFKLTATCTASGKSVEQTITVTVIPWCTGTPGIDSFTASPTTISSGQAASLHWQGISNGIHLMIFASGEAAPIVETFAPLAPSGSIPVSPAVTTTYTLQLECTGGGNQISREATVTVSNALPACAGDIGNFVFDGSSASVRDAQFLTIKPGESVALEWSAITNVDKVHFFGGGFDDDVSNPGIRIVTPSVKTTYDLTASCSANGNSIHGSVTVDVKP